MKILAIGDVVSSQGCDYLRDNLPKLKREHQADFVIVNGENSAVGNGITPKSAQLRILAAQATCRFMGETRKGKRGRRGWRGGVWNPRRPADTAGPDEKSPAAGSAKEREASNGFCEGGNACHRHLSV